MIEIYYFSYTLKLSSLRPDTVVVLLDIEEAIVATPYYKNHACIFFSGFKMSNTQNLPRAYITVAIYLLGYLNMLHIYSHHG